MTLPTEFSLSPMSDRNRIVPDWSALPTDAHLAVSTHLSDDADYVRFRSVCTSFRSSVPKRPLLPWILLVYGPSGDASDDDDDGDDDDDDDQEEEEEVEITELRNFPNTQLCRTALLPDGINWNKAVCGSSHGWLALVDAEPTPGISLHNPFTGTTINLPPLTDLPWSPISASAIPNDPDTHFDLLEVTAFLARKLVLSSDPTVASYLVLATSDRNERLIYCRSGDVSWTALPCFVDEDDRPIDDLVFYCGKFYVLYAYRLFVIDIGADSAHITEILPRDPLFSDALNRDDDDGYDMLSYLVVSSGDLLLVAIQIPYTYNRHLPYKFEVFRVDLGVNDMANGELTLVKLDNLGERSLFVGFGSMSVSAGSSSDCKGNCVYYIDEAVVGPKIVVFSMEDGSVSFVTLLSDRWVTESERVCRSTMYWLTPNLCH